MKIKDNAMVEIFTDGAARGNPGPGGWAAIVREDGTEKEYYGGFRLTTNNRMEMLAAYAGLKSLGEKPRDVILYSDSRLLTDSINKYWLNSWIRKNWKKSDGQPVLNVDIWIGIAELIKKHNVKFVWVKGHAGHAENERCDFLASSMADTPGLPADSNYEGVSGPDLFEIVESSDFTNFEERETSIESDSAFCEDYDLFTEELSAGEKAIILYDRINEQRIKFHQNQIPEFVKKLLEALL